MIQLATILYRTPNQVTCLTTREHDILDRAKRLYGWGMDVIGVYPPGSLDDDGNTVGPHWENKR